MKWVSEWNWLFNITCNNISVIYVTAHRCAGGLKKKLDLRSDSQCHRHFVGFFNMPVQAPTRGHPFYGSSKEPTHLDAFYNTLGIRRTYSHLKPPGSQRGNSRVGWFLISWDIGVCLLHCCVLCRYITNAIKCFYFHYWELICNSKNLKIHFISFHTVYVYLKTLLPNANRYKTHNFFFNLHIFLQIFDHVVFMKKMTQAHSYDS